MSPYLTIDEAAERARVSRSTFKKWMRAGLPVITFGPRLKRVQVEDLDRWMRSKIAGGTTSTDGLTSDSVTIQPAEKTEVRR